MMSEAQKTVEQHFSKCDVDLQKIYSRVIASVERFGPVTAESKKTTIHICNRTAFAGIRVMSNCVALTIKSDNDIQSCRIVNHEQTSANRWHLVVKLHSAKEIDKELVNWLRNAYDLSS